MEQSKKFFSLSNLIKLLVSALIVIWIVMTADWAQIVDVFSKIDPVFLSLAVGVFVINQYVIAIKLKSIIGIVDKKIHAFDILRANFVGSFLGLVFSSTIGVDIVRGYYLYRSGCSKDIVISSMLIDRMLGVVTVIVSGGVSLFFIPQVGSMVWLRLSYVLFVIVIIAFLGTLNVKFLGFLRQQLKFLRFQWLITKAQEFMDAYLLFAKQRMKLILPMFLSIVVILMRILSIYFITVALGEVISIGYYFLIIPTVIIAAMLPFAVAGIGIREGTLAALLMLFGMSENYAIAATLVSAIKITLIVIVAGVIFLMLTPKNVREQMKGASLA
ncbi:MAG: flippase-like domain-containing protein [Opitutales bacterium]|nr:flippase-like domain-containing protein [Opitutales bacterium]